MVSNYASKIYNIFRRLYGWWQLLPLSHHETSVNLIFYKMEYLFQFSTFCSHICYLFLNVAVFFNFFVFSFAKLTVNVLIIFDNHRGDQRLPT